MFLFWISDAFIPDSLVLKFSISDQWVKQCDSFLVFRIVRELAFQGKWSQSIESGLKNAIKRAFLDHEIQRGGLAVFGPFMVPTESSNINGSFCV